MTGSGEPPPPPRDASPRRQATEESRNDPGRVAPGSSESPTPETPLYDPSQLRDQKPRAPKTTGAELQKIEKQQFNEEAPLWQRIPATVSASVVAIPVELASNVLPGIAGSAAGVAGVLLMIPGAIADLRNWRKGRK